MYEYRVEKCKVNDAQDIMNKLANDGWRVVTVSPNMAMGMV